MRIDSPPIRWYDSAVIKSEVEVVMLLSWSNQTGIAEALHRIYPEEERLALSLEDIRERVIMLPGFAGPPQPPNAAFLRSILWTWMRLAGGGGSA